MYLQSSENKIYSLYWGVHYTDYVIAHVWIVIHHIYLLHISLHMLQTTPDIFTYIIFYYYSNVNFNQKLYDS